jgi:hypothetical protein
MQLEWFRKHKHFVYWVLLPIVGLGMAFFGATGAVSSYYSAQAGPSVTYKVGEEWHSLSSSEVMSLRYVLTQYMHRQASTSDAAYYVVTCGVAADAGFEIGDKEAKQLLIDQVKGRTSEPAATEGVYRKLLQNMQLTAPQFEQLSRQSAQWAKLQGHLMGQGKVNDAALYVAYAKEKEVVRLRYQEIRSEDFLDMAALAADEKIKEFYEKNKDNAAEYKDVMFTKPKLSAHMLFVDLEKLFGGEVKPTDDELKDFYNKNKEPFKIAPKAGEAAGEPKYKPFEEVKADVEKQWKDRELEQHYQHYRRIYWKVPQKPGEAPPAPADEKFKPYEEVKAEVEAKWKEQQKAQRGQARMSKLAEECREEQKKYEKEQAAKPEAERKPFDMAEWAKKHDLTYWATDTLTEDDYRKGKQDVGAKDAMWAQSLFWRMRDMPARSDEERQRQEEQRKSFGSPQITGKGAVIGQVKSYVTEQVRPLDEVKEAIAQRLAIAAAQDIAKEQAGRLRELWAEGKSLPRLDWLSEVRGGKDAREALVKKFFAAPRPVGEVLEAAEADAKESDPRITEPYKRYYIGFAVERDLPSQEQFHQDTTWPRDQKRTEHERYNARAAYETLSTQLRKMGKVVGDMKDPPLYRDRGGNEDY